MQRTAAKKTEKPALEPLPRDAVLLALDASSTAVGWAIFEGTRFVAAGVAKCPSSWRDSVRRMRRNTEEILEIINYYKVSHISIEWQDHRAAAGPKIQGLSILGHAQGYLLGVFDSLYSDILVDRIPVRESTKIGGKNLKKETRAQVIGVECPEYGELLAANPKADAGRDAADAISLGLRRLGLLDRVELAAAKPRKAKRRKR